ncbi:hypothetical protein SSX86_028394 [Deinandra increscens subsp. villosa]|uniref:Flavin-containing monooxygenase n=1 Tax=Deinandra increscens subsp. villosa TaxID=3103831 RepID=A0AAP0GJL5_9ASTR
MTDSLSIAVIGAGISGLLTARELLRENHRVTIFEKSGQIGGTWVYDHGVEVDDPKRSVVHSSLYSSLRTNLPRPLMSFFDYSFEDKSYGDPRMFPGHEEVLKFLQDFANEFGVTELIRFNSEVVRVESRGGGFVVEWQTAEEEVFDAVVVCNGHHTEPRFADDIPGFEEWSQKQVHSHNYRVPEPYKDQVLILIGDGPSAFDISREIATTAKEVHLSSRSSNIKVSKLYGYENIWQHMKIKRLFNEGTVLFEDGDSIVADVILHCTGYQFHFPFLRTNDMVHVDNNRVGPLYKHVFSPEHAPRLAFVGLIYSILFRMLELQAKWVALTLSGKILLPSKEEMLADVYKHYREMDENGIAKRYTHSLNNQVFVLDYSCYNFEYVDWLAAQVGLRVEDRLKKIVKSHFENRMAHHNDYRDTFLLYYP